MDERVNIHRRVGTDYALIVVDVQNDFVDGSLPVPGAKFAIRVINDLVTEAEDEGKVVMYTQDWHPADSRDHFNLWPAHCVADTQGAYTAPELKIAQTAFFLKKGTKVDEDGYSAFSNWVAGVKKPTGIVKLLDRLRVDTVVVVGIATDYCVRATALDAVDSGYITYVVPSATAAVAEETRAAALSEMFDAGVMFL